MKKAPNKDAVSIIADLTTEQTLYATRAMTAMKGIAKNSLDLGRVLVAAKQHLQHGEFTPMLESIGLNIHLANEYMRISKLKVVQTVEFSTLLFGFNNTQLKQLNKMDETKQTEIIKDGKFPKAPVTKDDVEVGSFRAKAKARAEARLEAFMTKEIEEANIAPVKKNGTRQTRLTKLQKDDKYGAYMEVRLYKNDPVQTARNISKHFGESFREPYIALLVELNRELKKFGNIQSKPIERDLYKSFSFGLSAISDGDLIEVRELLFEGIMSKKSVAESYGIGVSTISKAEKIPMEDINKLRAKFLQQTIEVA